MDTEQVQFRDHVVGSLAVLTTQSEAILARLDKINGSVSTLYGRTDALRSDIDKHALNCPVASKVKELEDFRTAQIAVAGSSAKWWAAIKPVIYVIAGMLAIVILKNLDVILGHLGIAK